MLHVRFKGNLEQQGTVSIGYDYGWRSLNKGTTLEVKEMELIFKMDMPAGEEVQYGFSKVRRKCRRENN